MKYKFSKDKLIYPLAAFSFVYLLLLSILEYLAYKKIGVFSVISARLWLVTALLLILAFSIFSGFNLYKDIKNKAYLQIIGILIPVIFLLFFIGNVKYSDINPDATQQLAAGLEAFKNPDFNYTGKAFLGYAARQFVIGALPAFIFGRSIFTLHLGFAYPFIIGYILLYFSIRKWLLHNDMPEKWALIPMYSFLAFRFIAEYYMNFEQAITPVALTMIVLALFIRLCIEPDIVTIIAMGLSVNLLCNSYTPAIASLGLLIAAFGVQIVMILYHNKKQRNFFFKMLPKESIAGICSSLCFMFYSAFMFFCTTLGERQDRLNSFRKDVNLFELITKSWLDFFFDLNAHFLGIFMLIVIAYIILSIAFRFTLWDVMVSCWVLGVVVFSNLMQGYTTYQESWILQRNMIVIPVLTVAIFFALARILQKHSVRIRLGYQIALMTFMMLLTVYSFRQPHQSFTYFNYIQSLKYMYSYMEESMKEMNLKPDDKFTVVLYTNSNLENNIVCYAAFFYPNATTLVKKTDDKSLPEKCDSPVFYFSTDKEVQAMKDAKTASKTYKNPRYKTEHTWYRTIYNSEEK